MKRFVSLIITTVLLLMIAGACARPAQALAAAELLDLGEKYLLDMDYDQAAVYFERLIEVEPRNSRGYTGLSEAYLGLGDAGGAVSTLRDGFAKLRDDDEFLAELAERYEDIIEGAPDTQDAYIGLADALLALGDEGGAADALQRGLERLPDSRRIAAMLAELDAASEAELPDDSAQAESGSAADGGDALGSARQDAVRQSADGQGDDQQDGDVQSELPSASASPTAAPSPALSPAPPPTPSLAPPPEPSPSPQPAGASPTRFLQEATPEFYVADYAGVLTSATKDNIIDSNGNRDNGLETLCDGAQIVVVTIKYLNDGMKSDEYARQLFSDWGVGSGSANNGMLLLLVTEEKKGWLEVGSGIRPYWTEDAIDSYLNYYFWEDVDAGRYDAAVNSLLEPLFSWYAEHYGLNRRGAAPETTLGATPEAVAAPDSASASGTAHMDAGNFEPGSGESSGSAEDPLLFSHIAFDGDCGDSVTGIVGVPHGDLKFVGGRHGQAVYLDGDGDYVSYGTGYNLPGEFTLNVWINADSLDRKWPAIFAKYETNHYGPYDFSLNYDAAGYWVSNGSGGHAEIPSAGKLEAGRWHMLTWVKSEGAIRMYIDGKHDSEGDSPDITQNSDEVTVGRQALMFAPYGDLQFKGMIDDIRIYSKALADSEIAALFAS